MFLQVSISLKFYKDLQEHGADEVCIIQTTVEQIRRVFGDKIFVISPLKRKLWVL